jgi:hypothetical protein
MVGVVGTGLTITFTVADVPEAQPLEMTSTEKVPLVSTVIDWLTSPLLQKLCVAADEVSVTDPPSQNVVAPEAVIVGVAGTGFTITGITFDVPEEQPLETASTE